MKKQIINKICEKIKAVLKIKIYNIHIFYCISLIYVLMWIIDNCNPHELYKFFTYSFIYVLGYMFFVYLPEIIIHIFDFTVKKFAIENKIAVKIIKTLIITLGYVYFILLCLLFIGARGLFIEY